jgi:hypothetical protein
MPRRDKFHQACKDALIKDGWTITHDPLMIEWGKKDLFVDLGAERLLAAEKGTQKIAVEIKGFEGHSETNDLENALGQYLLYRAILSQTEQDRVLYLAVPEEVLLDTFMESIGKLVAQQYALKILAFEPSTAEVKQWIH